MASMPLACASLWGIDDGSPKDDAAADDAISLSDVEIREGSADHVSPTDADPPGDDGSACVSQADWCTGRCESTKDNCGHPVKCGECEAGVACTDNVCGCVPDSLSVTCGGRQCGQVINNCHLAVNCGPNGQCAPGDVCLTDAGMCCVPDNNAAACGNKCQTTVTNNCGQTVPCTSTCPNSESCVQNTCCVSKGCGGSCIDTCGVYSLSCCAKAQDASLPFDSGIISVDAGACGQPNSACSASPQCCSARCSYSGSCVPMCGLTGGPCTSSTDCCYGLTCHPGAITQSSGSGMQLSPSMCGP